MADGPDAGFEWSGSPAEPLDRGLGDTVGHGSRLTGGRRRAVLFAVGAGAVAAVVVISAELAAVGPFASAPDNPQARSTVASAAARGALPTGQWLASGLTDAVTGNVANASLDGRDVRAWDFARVCTGTQRCRSEFLRQLEYGGTIQATLVPITGNTWYRAVFAPQAALCAREPSGPTPRETIDDTIDLSWSTSHRQLIADETQTITGCGALVPSTIEERWTATAVAQPAAPRISLNPTHTTTLAAFRAAALRQCTHLNAQATPLANKIAAAEKTLRSAMDLTAKANAETTIANELAPLLPLSVQEYTQIPQPPPGAFDALWLRDIADNRRQLAPGAAAWTALLAAIRATSGYLSTGNPLDQQTAVAESTFYSEDAVELHGDALASNQIEQQQLRLPAICINPPAINAIFSTPAAL